MVPNSSGTSSSKPKFAVYSDPNQSQPPRTKKARLDAPRLSTINSNAVNDVEISTNRLPPPPPSLKDRSAFGALMSPQNMLESPPKANSQRVRAMLFSPPAPQNAIDPSPTSFLTSRNNARAHKEPRLFPQSPLKSPFRPVFKSSNLKSTTKPAPAPVIRRPSEGTALHRTLAPKSTRRRPSDSYAITRRPRPSSFLKNFAPPSNTKLTRDPSLLDALQNSTPKTPPNLFPLKSPSVLNSSEARGIAPIPRIMMQLDTPSRDADQLVADMSHFSLAPDPDDIMSSPTKKPTALTNNDTIYMVVDGDEMQYQPQITQSSPGIEIPSVQDDSWCLPAVSHSSPIKSIVASSSDPLDLFHPIRFPPTPRRLRLTSRAKRISAPVLEDISSGRNSFKKLNKVYGKQRARRSVRFANHDERSKEQNEEDMSEDELLLK